MCNYRYDTCDLGTFPNQTRPDGSGPAAALFSEQSRSRYRNELSWLAGQRVSYVLPFFLFPPSFLLHSFPPSSFTHVLLDLLTTYHPLYPNRACTCPGEEHPGPTNSKGRGAPEIDIFEASRDKSRPPIGGTVSQSAQFAPFTHDYLYLNESTEYWENFNAPGTRPNAFRGSAV